MDRLDVDVAIAGGGLCGLALAVGLQERGIDAHVFEKAPALRTDSATAISMALNGMRAVEGLKPGLSKEMYDLGLESDVKHIVRIEGKPQITIPVDHKKGEFFMIGWRFSQELLASKLEASRIHCNHRFMSYKPTEDGRGVDAEYLVATEGGHETRVVRAKVLIGADGLWSNMRKQMIGDTPRYLNFVNWNAMIYNPGGKVFKYAEGEVHMLHSADSNIVGYISDLGHGYVLWLLRILDEDGSLAADFLDRSSGKKDAAVCKERALRHLNIPGWEDLRGAIEATDPELIYERRSMDRAPLDKWSDCNGHAVLVGDAAHGMYSALGMGARTAFEDAHQLTLFLEEAFQAQDPSTAISEAVSRFEEVRVERIKRIHTYATELTDRPQFMPNWTLNLTQKERVVRLNEFLLWTCQYPENPSYDPQSKNWGRILPHSDECQALKQ